ncbi:CAAX protease [Thermoclostridium stercorarium subsp. stercorarium DSM 8532]|nr:CAAX protease [Thermoclostridium stercorarium subsp. stercorarium DSM 8532]
MEIPQRLMMQSFVYGMLKILGVSWLDLYTVIVTGFIWCLCIVIQTILFKEKFDDDMIYDILASMVFSLGIGYVYQKTGLIIISMIAHFCERVLSCVIFSKKA